MARQPRKPTNPLDVADPRFEGSAYSMEELAFLIAHFGENAMQAMPPEEDLPEGVNEAAVGPILDRTYALDQYQNLLRERHEDETLQIWVGFDEMKAVCEKTLEWLEQCAELKRRTKGASAEVRLAAAVPSLHMWDPSTDRPSLYGVGSDTDRVLTALTPEGQRVELYTELRQMGIGAIKALSGVAAFIKKTKATQHHSDKLLETTPDTLTIEEDEDNGIVKCPLCGKAETYRVSVSAQKRRALSLMTKHCKEESVSKVDQHHLLYKRLVSGRAGAKTNRIPASAAVATAEADE